MSKVRFDEVYCAETRDKKMNNEIFPRLSACHSLGVVQKINKTKYIIFLWLVFAQI